MAQCLTFFLFFICCLTLSLGINDNSLSSVERKIETKFAEYLTNRLDKSLVSVVGRMLHYGNLEKEVSTTESRGMKKIGAILPVIFFLGMSAAWTVLTTLLTAKSVTIGLVLLVLKIAVGSAKLASYFTEWKHNHHHVEYIPHHGNHRTLRSLETHFTHHQDWHEYTPELTHEPHASSPYYAQAYEEYPETKKVQDKKHL